VCVCVRACVFVFFCMYIQADCVHRSVCVCLHPLHVIKKQVSLVIKQVKASSQVSFCMHANSIHIDMCIHDFSSDDVAVRHVKG
jgi:hypothetical protein